MAIIPYEPNRYPVSPAQLARSLEQAYGQIDLTAEATRKAIQELSILHVTTEGDVTQTLLASEALWQQRGEAGEPEAHARRLRQALYLASVHRLLAQAGVDIIAAAGRAALQPKTLPERLSDLWNGS